MPHESARLQAAPGLAEAELKALLVSATGHYRLSHNDGLVFDKVRARLAATGLPSIEAYLDYLKNGLGKEAELDGLIAGLTVGETYFFRHPDQFDALRDRVLPECLARNAASKQLRIWSAGCANGAETYSIAIAVRALLGERAANWNVSIVGSDINRAFLAEAEAGRYSDWALREMPDGERRAWFTQSDRFWVIKDRYREHVSFVNHNLVTGECPSIHKNIFAFDIVFCRNVMIYFGNAENRAVIEKLRDALVNGGFLFIAPSDYHAYLDGAFAPARAPGAIVFRKRGRPTGAAAARHLAPVADPAVEPRPLKAKIRPPARPDTLAAPQPTASPDLDSIVAAANRGDWAAAMQTCETLLERDICDVAAHYYYALIRHYSGAPAEAERALKRAVYLDPQFALAHYQIGLLRKQSRDPAGCARAFRNALESLVCVPDAATVSPCGQVTALDLRELASQQLSLLAAR
ncbi:MAG: CheR family methyltransferase [Cucumibacter sp.]